MKAKEIIDQRVVRSLPAGLLQICFFALLTIMPSVEAQPLEQHAFVVRSGEVSLHDGIYRLNAAIDFNLSPAAEDALESGVPLTFELRIELVRPRRFWLDETVAHLTQRYRIRFHALSQRYVLTDLNTDESQNFSSSYSALSAMGAVRSLPIIDRDLLDSDKKYELWLRAGLDVDDLPPPLRTGAYLSPQWRLLSEWYVWRFRA